LTLIALIELKSKPLKHGGKEDAEELGDIEQRIIFAAFVHFHRSRAIPAMTALSAIPAIQPFPITPNL
jgi:hypothetical protein